MGATALEPVRTPRSYAGGSTGFEGFFGLYPSIRGFGGFAQ
jgi:hypothetical protein